jgi:hypothetical protein
MQLEAADKSSEVLSSTLIQRSSSLIACLNGKHLELSGWEKMYQAEMDKFRAAMGPSHQTRRIAAFLGTTFVGSSRYKYLGRYDLIKELETYLMSITPGAVPEKKLPPELFEYFGRTPHMKNVLTAPYLLWHPMELVAFITNSLS